MARVIVAPVLRSVVVPMPEVPFEPFGTTEVAPIRMDCPPGPKAELTPTFSRLKKGLVTLTGVAWTVNVMDIKRAAARCEKTVRY